MDRDERDLTLKVVGLVLGLFISGGLLAWAVYEILFATEWRKLVGLGLLAVGFALWGLTFWLIADRPKTWSEPGRNPSRRHRLR